MAAWFNLQAHDHGLDFEYRINRELIGTVEVRRLEVLDISNPDAIAGVWSTYEVRRDGRLIGQVRHMYGHGAWRLLEVASSLLGNDDLARRRASGELK